MTLRVLCCPVWWTKVKPFGRMACLCLIPFHAEVFWVCRGVVTMEQPCMRAYSLLLIKTCHRRGVFAMGGMSAQIPVKNNPQANEAALQKVCMMADNHGVPGQGLRCSLTLQGSAKYWPVACRIVPAAREMRRQYMALYGRIRFGPRPARRTQVHPVALPPHMYNCCSLVRCPVRATARPRPSDALLKEEPDQRTLAALFQMGSYGMARRACWSRCR